MTYKVSSGTLDLCSLTHVYIVAFHLVMLVPRDASVGIHAASGPAVSLQVISINFLSFLFLSHLRYHAFHLVCKHVRLTNVRHTCRHKLPNCVISAPEAVLMH